MLFALLKTTTQSTAFFFLSLLHKHTYIYVIIIAIDSVPHQSDEILSATYLYVVSHQRWSRGHKVRGQGHKKNPRPRPRTAFPRTEPLEAKDRNARGQGQGPRTQAQVFSKKKNVFQKIFLGDLQFISVPRIFDWGRSKPQITWNDIIKIFPKRKFLWDKYIVGWKIWNRWLLARNQDFAKGDDLN